MGLANLCEHAFRLADRGESGPQGLAKLDRRVSAVTAACMLVKRSLYESLGGLDEAFAIALNDVDFCLRAGQAGACIVLAAGVEMYHFESMSLGRHYQGWRAHLEAIEVRRLRESWAGVIAADPYYHPCASLELGREFQPGFPPRQTPLSWISQDTLAPA
jgi:GT2 family glycosyltransferase